MSEQPGSSRDTRTRLLDRFAAQLVERGYLGISLETVASDCGIRKASLYHHFPGGKAQLFRELAEAYIQQETARLSAALSGPGGLVARLTAIASLHTEPSTHPADLDQAIYQATRHLPEELRSEVSHAYVQGLIDPVTDLMNQAVAARELAPADPGFLSWTFLTMASSLTPIPPDLAMPPSERPSGPTGSSAAVQSVVTLFLDGARGPAGGSDPQ